ncbi:MAG TPA: polysaccharide deacetylase family protein [Solirubrobacteraceae bacterium]|nr:polysaccharide deacetylase family protein [Solirubrobacteraceae bacterium]
MTNVRRLICGMSATLVAVAVVVAVAAGASRAPVQPLRVQASSLTQVGQDLVWQVELTQPFSPGGLGKHHESLCLLIERASSGSTVAQVCLAGPRPGSAAPRLLYSAVTRVGPGSPAAIAAAVTRSSDRELTASFLPSSVGVQYRALRWQVLSTLSGRGCSGAAPGTSTCSTLYPAAPSLLPLHTPRLVGCVPSGPDQVFTGPRKVREIALTFDDGPWDDPPTADFVRELARLHAPATFFEIGEHIPTYDPGGTVEREMLADGDMIGDHTWSHPDLVGLSVSEQRQQLSLAAREIRSVTGGFEPCLFRAPYGAVDPSLLELARSMGFTTIQWDIDPRDWALPGEGEIIDNVLENAHDGGIVEEHFGGGPRYETLDALPEEIAGLRKQGYQLVTLTQMLGYKLVYR